MASGSNKKVANSLVALSAAAVLAVYAAGYERTRSAADKLDAQTAERRPAAPEGMPTPEGRRGEAPPLPPVPPPAASLPDARPETRPGAGAPPMQVASLEHPPASVTSGSAESTAAGNKPDAPIASPAAPVPSPPVAMPETAPAPVAVSVPAPPAPPVASAPPEPAAPSAPKWKDGTYTGWGTCRHGDIQASVVIEQGRIASATIAQCLTRYSCSVISRLPPEVAQRQSAQVDWISGATQSSDAFYYAVTDALNHAK